MVEEVNADHLLVVVCARKDSISYHPLFEHLPEMIDEYYANVSLMMIYPDQFDDDRDTPSLFDTHTPSSSVGYETSRGWLSRLGKLYKNRKQ